MSDKILKYSSYDISDRIISVAEELHQHLSYFDNVEKCLKSKKTLYVCVLNGAAYFFADITRMLPCGECIYMRASSYGDSQKSGEIHMSTPEIKNGESFEEVVIFDDICDSGKTLETVKRLFVAITPNANIRTAVLIDRLLTSGKKVHTPDFAAISTDSNIFFAGYGMDNKGMDRNCPYIYDCTEV